jgi:hypothetical protein
LRPGSYSVGRTNCDLLLTGDRNVSRRHATLDVSHKLVRLTDLNSSCGTFDPSGARVEEPYSMCAGDWVVLGRTKLRVVSVAEISEATGRSSSAMTQPELELDLGDV